MVNINEKFKRVIEILKKQKDDLNCKAINDTNIYRVEDTIDLVAEYIDAIDVLENVDKYNKINRKNEIYRNVDIDIGTKTEALKYRNVTIELTNNFMKIFNGTRLIFHKIDDIVIFDIKESDKNV